MPKPKQSIIPVPFPIGGENRKRNYSEDTPITTHRAINVRGVDPLEKRGRGGSRPGLSKFLDNYFGSKITGMSSVTYIDLGDGTRHQDLAVIADGTLYVVSGGSATETTSYLTVDGDKLTINGDYLTFGSTVASVNPLGDTDAFQMDEKDGKLYVASSTLQEYNPKTGAIRTVPNAPESQPLICIYQHRIVLSGANHIFYMSKQDDVENWSFAGDVGDVGQAVAGHAGGEGIIGEVINALLPWEDKALVIGTENTISVIYGNPAGGGEKRRVSRFVGTISPSAMDVTPDGLVVFLSKQGLYTWQIGSESDPEPFSESRVPEELLDIDTTAVNPIVTYDHKSKGVHLFLSDIS